LGHSRSIRSDDWLLDIPLILAQVNHNPSFPIVNSNIGLGQNSLLPLKVPCRHFVTLFRPSTWGFLMGESTGLAWMWWFIELGTFYVGFLLFSIVTRQNFWVSFWAALALTYSPYFQFWSFHKTELFVHAGLILVSLSGILRGQTRTGIAINGI